MAVCRHVRSLPLRVACHKRLATITAAARPHKLVFLGTPEVAAGVLQRLLRASCTPDASFSIAAVVTQPGRPRGRGKQPQPSPVHVAALDSGLSSDKILCPASARDAAFLERLQGLAPDLCITAAYGNILPQSFLDIPRHGTLNIHPSLLPCYRGAAPVQRALQVHNAGALGNCLLHSAAEQHWHVSTAAVCRTDLRQQDGVKKTGVSLAFTVRKMDAGPVLAQQAVEVDDAIQAPELLHGLFELGTELLLQRLSSVWTGEAEQLAKPQDEAAATHAAKLQKHEAPMRWQAQSAQQLHNQVRALVPWPGATLDLLITSKGGDTKPLQLKVLRSRVGDGRHASDPEHPLQASSEGGLVVPCAGGGSLEVLQVQPPGGRAMSTGAWLNGMAGRTVRLSLNGTS